MVFAVVIALPGIGAPPAEGKVEKTEKLAKKDVLPRGKEGKEGSEEGGPKKRPILQLQLPVGHSQKGLRVPYFAQDGKRKEMQLEVGEATLLDADNALLKSMKLQTFTPKGAVDFSIDLPECAMNLVTGELTSEKPVEIRTTDFSLRSSSIRFDTQQKKGELRGKVRMEIFGDLLQPVSTPVESKKEAVPKI
jgi:hypothetical protein